MIARLQNVFVLQWVRHLISKRHDKWELVDTKILVTLSTCWRDWLRCLCQCHWNHFCYLTCVRTHWWKCNMRFWLLWVCGEGARVLQLLSLKNIMENSCDQILDYIMENSYDQILDYISFYLIFFNEFLSMTNRSTQELCYWCECLLIVEIFLYM